MRINVKKRTEGWFQLAFQPLPDTVDGNYYRLSFKARNQSRASAAFCVRPLNAIQEYVFIEHGNFLGSWEKYSFAYHTKANNQPIGFFIIVYGEGAFDISGLQLIEQSESEYLEDTKFIKLLTLADGVYAYLFSGQNRLIAVLSSKYNHAEFKIPQNDDIKAFDLFGNPKEDKK